MVRSRTCTDKDAIRSVLKFADDHRFLVEPACGAALSALYSPELNYLQDLPTNRPIVVIVCGGAVITQKALAEFAKKFGLDNE